MKTNASSAIKFSNSQGVNRRHFLRGLGACLALPAFGSLALSGHPGTASMGELLLVSLGCTLVATFAFVPALLASVRRS